MEARTFSLMVLWTVWALAWAGSFAAFLLTEPSSDGFARGINRVMAFLGWQGVAAMLAFAVLGLGREWPRGHPVRRASAIPVILAGILAVSLVGFVAWGRFGV
ncbi:MAG: hypothetical protein AAGK37_15595 [Pseudomonadota bacterium]